MRIFNENATLILSAAELYGLLQEINLETGLMTVEIDQIKNSKTMSIAERDQRVAVLSKRLFEELAVKTGYFAQQLDILAQSSAVNSDKSK